MSGPLSERRSLLSAEDGIPLSARIHSELQEDRRGADVRPLSFLRCTSAVVLGGVVLALVAANRTSLYFSNHVDRTLVEAAMPAACAIECAYNGWSASCATFVQWAANHKFSGPQACQQAYGLTLAHCPVCVQCPLELTTCVAGKQPSQETTSGYENKGCDTECHFGGWNASCRHRIDYYANHDFRLREAYECVEGYGLTMKRCPDCVHCDLEAANCRVHAPDDALELKEVKQLEHHDLVEKPGACNVTCSYKGHDETCRGLVQYAANHRFDLEDQACAHGHAEVIKRCPMCRECTLPATGCKEGIQDSTYVSPHSCKAYGCNIPFAPLDFCQCSEDCKVHKTCCADFGRECEAPAPPPPPPAPAPAPKPAPAAPKPAPVPQRPLPPGAYINNYDPHNPLKIGANPVRRANYFLIIGDWGKAGLPGPCQVAVAEMMKTYVQNQKEAGNELLFIASVGDNFYWTGVHPGLWGPQWANPYGTWDPASPLFHVPWLSVLGNHDLGNTDFRALCPAVESFSKINGQVYGSQQFNGDRNPTRPDHSCNIPAVVANEPGRCAQNTSFYWMPDHNWHYELPEASLEVIGLDTNFHMIDVLGGDASGHGMAFAHCGGRQGVASHFQIVLDAAMLLLKERAQHNTADTVLIIQHYPGHCMKDIFLNALPEHRRDRVHVLCAYGHVHDQKCEGNDPKTGICNTVMTGGGGGCCGPEVNLGGFTAVQLDDNGGFVTDVESPQVRMPFGKCMWAGQPVPPPAKHATAGEIR